MLASDIVDLLHKNDRIVLISHVMPDGDTLGSLLALAIALRQKNKEVVCLCSDPVPSFYAFLPQANTIKLPQDSYEGFPVAIAIDCSDRERLGRCVNIFSSAIKTVNIDHHISNTYYGEYNLVIPSAAATGEIVYQIIKLLNVNMDMSVATCLYAAIVTDTGRFGYDSTTAVTLEIAADLLNCGVEVSELNERLFNQRSLQRTLLLGKALNTLEICCDGRMAFMRVDRPMLNEVNADESDCDGLVNYARDIDTVEVGLLFKETAERHIKVSLRSKRYVNVSVIAAEFGGGGHERAAGCTIRASMDDAINIMLQRVSKALEDKRI